jgi:hypothetical protein
MWAMTLTEFLTARLDEDEAGADDFHDARRCGSLDRDGGFTPGQCDCGYPARVLREVEAKRKILNQLMSDLSYRPPVPSGHRRAWAIASLIVEAMAAIYSDHPDYDPAWT